MLTLPLNPQLPQVNARVLASYPVIEQPDIHTLEDISVSEISPTILPRPKWMPLAMGDYHGRNFRTLGFNSVVGGQWFQELCVGMIGYGRSITSGEC